jgi:hypothetical protein
LLLVRAAGDDDDAAAAAALAGSVAAWAATASAVVPLLDATRAYLWRVLDRAAADHTAAAAWRHLLDAHAAADGGPWEAWLRSRGTGTQEAPGSGGTSRTNGSSGSPRGFDAPAVLAAVAGRRTVRVPLAALLPGGLARYRPNARVPEEERVGTDEDEDEGSNEREGLDQPHHGGGGGWPAGMGGGVAVASSLGGGLRALLAACPTIPLADLDERLDPLFAPPSPDSALDGPAEGGAWSGQGSGGLFGAGFGLGGSVPLSAEGELGVAWGVALERLRARHEATPGARALLFADPLPLRTTEAGEETSESNAVAGGEEHEWLLPTRGECHMLLLPPPPPLLLLLTSGLEEEGKDAPASRTSPEQRDRKGHADDAPPAVAAAPSDSAAAAGPGAAQLLAAFEATADAALLVSWRGPGAVASRRPGAVRARVVCVSGKHASAVTLAALLPPGPAAPGGVVEGLGSGLDAHVRSLLATFAPRQRADADTTDKESLAEAAEARSVDQEAWDAAASLLEGTLPCWMVDTVPCGVPRRAEQQQQRPCAVS